MLASGSPVAVTAASRPLIAITMGEPAGVGGELVLMAWQRRQAESLGPFLLIDDPARVAGLAERLGLAVPVQVIGRPEQAAAWFDRALPVLALATPLAAPVVPGRLDPANGPAVVGAIDQAVALAALGRVAALVTNPIHKAALYRCGFGFAGHTEYLAHLAAPHPAPALRPVMMLVVPGLRVVPVTIHVSLRTVVAGLDTEEIVSVGRITAAALARDFGLARPRLAVAALNPHAGEDGAMGDEEVRIIAPAIARLREDGIVVSGPHPADTLFHPAARETYDVALCMYHDQALIPLKTIDFARGVNVTLGLPFVRTSPDHGTALDLAGGGRADPASLCEALRLAAAVGQRRRVR